MEDVITALVNRIVLPLANAAAWLATSGVAFVIFVVLWIGFGAALIWSQGSLDAAWQWVQGLPLIVQAIVWLLLLPVVAGLWIWETTWPFIVRIALVVGLAGWSIWIFLPKALQAGRP
jgi:hypothetical protein